MSGDVEIIVAREPTIEAIPVVQPELVAVTCKQVELIAGGFSGNPGPRGPGSQQDGIAGANLFSFTMLVNIDGLLYPADPTNIDHSGQVVGMALASVLSGASVSFATDGGEAVDGSFTPGADYFVGLNGVPSTTPVAAGAVWAQGCGVGNDSTSFSVILGPPTDL